MAESEAPITVSIASGQCRDGITKVQVSVNTISEGVRQASDIACVLDVSGSMGSEATIVGASGQSESHGLSLLDVAKHAVRTIISAVSDSDRLSIIAFNHAAQVVLQPTAMDGAGKEEAEECIDKLNSSGGTNIWTGLLAGMDALRGTASGGRLGHVMLLTAGESQDRATIVPNMLDYKQQHEGLPGTINTFGFGYNLDSKLLVEMSLAGSGSYSFIPDAGFVGTCFVSMLSQVLVTAGREVYLQLDKDDAAELVEPLVHGNWSVEDKGDFWNIGVGTLQYGQSKDLVFPMRLKPEAELCASLRYEDSARKQVEARSVVVKMSESQGAADLGVEEQWCRCTFVEALVQAQKLTAESRSEEAVKKALQVLMDASEKVKASPAAETPNVKALLEDVTGQSTEALSKQEWYFRWGTHYLPSVMFAHKLQMCNNFKDPGVQHYGGELFRKLRDEADDIFCKLPAPKPTARSYGYSGGASAAPVSMAATMTAVLVEMARTPAMA
eukprot:CAMPEP_0172674210 /NCGR_PEP_ID=MMETSP1074-20121228/12616_1 /TAXON_ID=2916 /ORGANISM="Ceratium fusus, Strain PA161109" /LENGTH=498 /DNA_ID=CAMNT_0013491609 /DNA_START=11 /DNA_END=1504 /DNA_ORIENTATION=-